MTKTTKKTKKETVDKKLDKKIDQVVDVNSPANAESSETKQTKTIKTRSRAYKAAKSKIDISKYYPLAKAIQLVKDTSLSKFDGKIEAHINTTLTPGKVGEINFPHLKTKSKKVAIANDKLIKDIQAGKIDFDILVATPTLMPKILPLARILGPKGLMPNPKNGTLTDKPDEAVKKFSTAAVTLSTEKKAPLIHIVVGLISQPQKELEANIKELIRAINPVQIKKLVLCASMGPAVKVKLQ